MNESKRDIKFAVSNLLVDDHVKDTILREACTEISQFYDYYKSESAASLEISIVVKDFPKVVDNVA